MADSIERLVDRRELRTLVPYSDTHLRRLEAAGEFPKRVKLGKGPQSRVAWLWLEVTAWMEAKKSARAQSGDAAS